MMYFKIVGGQNSDIVGNGIGALKKSVIYRLLRTGLECERSYSLVLLGFINRNSIV